PRAAQEAKRGPQARVGREADDEEEHHADDGYRRVLAAQVRDGALAHRAGDLAHAVVAVGQAQDPRDLPDTVKDGEYRARERENDAAGHSVFLPGKLAAKTGADFIRSAQRNRAA